jgi:hypothetical protein
MTAYGFIVGYVSLWLGWSSLVGLAFHSLEGRATSLGARTSALIATSAFVPIGALSLTAYCTRWIPTSVNAMLSLMTPLLLTVFVLQRLGELRSPQAPRPSAEARSSRARVF